MKRAIKHQLMDFMMKLCSDEVTPLWRGNPPDVRECDDGSIEVRWRTADKNLSFVFDENPAESGWFFSTRMSAGGESGHGGFGEGFDLARILKERLP